MTATTRPPTLAAIRAVLEAASRAPSVRNTQPWRWCSRGRQPEVLELHADDTRRLSTEDPAGRNMVISCGAVLHHAQVAALALGWQMSVDRLPEGTSSTLLARATLTSTRPPSDARALLADLERRCTDRRRFTSWPVPRARLVRLADEAQEWGVRARPVLDRAERFQVELLAEQALEQRRGSRAATDLSPEGTSRADRASSDAFPRSEEPDLRASDGLIVLCSPDDDAGCWLRAGEGLSALWLAATREGLSVVPLSQVVEVDATRSELRRGVLGGLAHPLLLLRLGWQPIGRSELPRTGRRPLDDVLEIG